VWTGYKAIVETSHPDLATIRDRAALASALAKKSDSVND